jgi:hypothetical protein
MSHLRIFGPKPDYDEKPTKEGKFRDYYLSVRTGTMSFIQYGFELDPRDPQDETKRVPGRFDSGRVVLLVLNDHRNVHYQFEGDDELRSLGPMGSKNSVVILWPGNEEPPRELSPAAIFPHTRASGGPCHWPRESYAHPAGSHRPGGDEGNWDTALVLKDSSRRYVYEYITDGRNDAYRFELDQNAKEMTAWLWEEGKPKPQHLLPEGVTLKRAVQTESGGPQEEGGALPYPPA